MNAKPKQSEAELCCDFIAWAHPQGWTAYAETGGWDIVLVRSDGVQIGVQAKLRFNATVLRQTIPARAAWDDIGPDYRAILLPDETKDIREVCEFCGLAFFRRGRYDSGDRSFVPRIDSRLGGWLVWPAKDRVPLPAYVPDVAAGASGPLQLSEWKVGALKICAWLEIRGFVTRADFRAAGIDHRRWVPMKWLDIRDGNYVRGETLPFPEQHPVVYSQILAELRDKEAAA